jgi:hypothetical protein
LFWIARIRDGYQLRSANGYILKNMTNKKRIRRLKPELYKDEFWAASNWLQKHDELAKQREINELDILARKANIENLELQKRGKPHPLTNFAEITRRRQDLEALQAVTVTTNLAERPARQPLRFRRPTFKTLEASATS